MQVVILPDTTSYLNKPSQLFDVQSTKLSPGSTESKPSRLKRLKLNYNSQPFVSKTQTETPLPTQTDKIAASQQLLVTKKEFKLKLTQEDADAQSDLNTTKSTENSQRSEERAETAIAPTEIVGKKKRIRKGKLRNEKDSQDTKPSTTDKTAKDNTEDSAKNKAQAEGFGKYAITPKKPVALCNICLDPLYSKSKPLIYHDFCFTWLHRDCFGEYIHASIKSGNVPVKCPDEGCNQEVPEKKIALFLSETENLIYLKKLKFHRAMLNAETHVFCTTPDCEHIFEIDPQISKEKPKLDCPLCKKSTCANCRVMFHKAFTCDEYLSFSRDDHAAIDMFGVKKWAKCLKCKFWIEKNEGCHHITCKCTHQFCYLCLAPWKTCTCPQS